MYRLGMRIGGWAFERLGTMNGRQVSFGMITLVLLFASVWAVLRAQGAAESEVDGVPREIQAQRFVVVDDTGKERAEFGILPNGEAGMIVWNKGKSALVSLRIDQAGMPHFVFENSHGRALLELGVLENRSPILVMRDAEGRRRLGIMVTEGGSVAIGFYDTLKRNRCTVGLSQPE